MNSNLRVALVFGALSTVAGGMYACGGDDDGGNAGTGGMVCTPYQPNPMGCFCTTGGTGTQNCLANGAGYDVCNCGGSGSGGAAGFAGTGGAGGSTDCGGGEVCNSAPIGGINFCGPSGSTLPPSCPNINEACGLSGGTCQMLAGINGCYKPCTPVGGSGGTGGTAGFSGTGGTGGTAGFSGTGGTGGTAGFSGTGGTGGTAGFSGTGGTGGTAGTSGTGGTGGTTPGCSGGDVCNTAIIGMFKFCAPAGSFIPPACATAGMVCGDSSGTCLDGASFGFAGTFVCVKPCT